MKKFTKIFVVLVILIVVICFLCISQQLFPKETTSFYKQVQYLEDHILFCNFHLGISCLDVSTDDVMTNILYRYEANPIFSISRVAVRPDNSTFYVFSTNQLLEFDRSMRLLRCIPISEFNFSMQCEFYGAAYASNDVLWFTVRKGTSLAAERSKEANGFVVQWNPIHSPRTRLIGPEVDSGSSWAVDFPTRKVYTCLPEQIIYDFTTNSASKHTWGHYTFVDFDEKHGLLLSCGPQKKKAEIARVDLKTGLKTNITKGSWALWGYDDNIYFVRGGSQLWRCKLDGSDVCSVYIASSSIRYDERRPPSIALSTNKEFLSFFYDFYSFGTEKRGTVLLDLTRNEYRLLENIGFRTMAWIEMTHDELDSSGRASKVLPAQITPPFFMSLHDAVFSWDVTDIEELLKHNVMLDVKDKLGNTPLHYAAELGRSDVVELLIRHGADVNLPNINGATSLHKAVEGPIYKYRKPFFEEDRLETVQILLNAGADPEAENKFHLTPVDLALRKGQNEITDILAKSKSGNS